MAQPPKSVALFKDEGAAQVPSAQLLQSFLVTAGRDLDPEVLESAASAHRALRLYVEKMRQVELPYLWAVEPNAVFEWIEAGGQLGHP